MKMLRYMKMQSFTNSEKLGLETLAVNELKLEVGGSPFGNPPFYKCSR